jgi:CHAT domain-containing protein/tetratricopeptide (TPR) repeat protein
MTNGKNAERLTRERAGVQIDSAGSTAQVGRRVLLLWLLLAAVGHSTSGVPHSFPLAPGPVPARGLAKQTDVGELKLGQAVERELRGGESHAYQIALVLGQYLHVVVEQKGIDVVVRLFAPDGKKLTEVDGPYGPLGTEPVYAITEMTGEYHLEVKALDEKAAPGRYEIELEELRQSKAQDRDRIAAAQVFAEGEQFRAQGTAEALPKATAKYNEALKLWRTGEDRQEEARTLNRLGSIYWTLGEYQKPLEYYNQALPLWQMVGNRREEARTLHNIGTVYWQIGDSRKALEYYAQALPLSLTAGDRQLESITLNAIGLAYDNLGKLREALHYYNQALTLQRTMGEHPNEANTLTHIGSTYYNLGEFQKALEAHSQALALNRAAGDRRGEAVTLNNIGVLYWRLGETGKALEFYNQALPLRRATGDRNGEFSTLHNLGLVHLSLGEPQKSLEYYNQALTLVRALGDRRGEAVTLQDIGQVYQQLGDLQKALEYDNQALRLQRAIGNQIGEALTLSYLGASYISLGKPKEALSYLEQALSLHRAIGDQVYEPWTLQKVARAERDLGHLGDARARMDEALKIIERTRSQFVSQELRTSYLASNRTYYEFYIDLLMRLHQLQPASGHEAAALEASERARARSLLDILTESRADIRQGVDAALLERERSSQQQLNLKSERLTRLLSGKDTEAQATAAKKEVEAALAEYQGIEDEIRAQSPRYAALTKPQPLGLKEIQQQVLDENTLLLEYALGEERSYLWAVTSTSVSSYELPKRAEIEAAARRFYELVTTAKNRTLQSQAEAAALLSRTLLGPAANQLGQKRLLIVPDGAIQYIPFAALPEPAAQGKRPGAPRPLVANHEIVSLPSASVMAVLRRETAGRKPAAKEVAVLADPVFQSDDPRIKQVRTQAENSPATLPAQATVGNRLRPDVERSAWEAGVERLKRLPYTRKEAEAIVANAPGGQSLKAVDFDANRRAALAEELGEYRIVHFATHGLLNNVHPELSGIVLSLVDEHGQPQNGFVRLHEVYNLRLPAELVVLSACQTALGKEVKGEGLVGLTRGFMYAGAERVVVSLWAVNDEATAEFMEKFYEAMLKRRMRPAAALREAQVVMSKSKWWRAPYFWAGFIIQGEWR